MFKEVWSQTKYVVECRWVILCPFDEQAVAVRWQSATLSCLVAIWGLSELQKKVLDDWLYDDIKTEAILS